MKKLKKFYVDNFFNLKSPEEISGFQTVTDFKEIFSDYWKIIWYRFQLLVIPVLVYSTKKNEKYGQKLKKFLLSLVSVYLNFPYIEEGEYCTTKIESIIAKQKFSAL